MNEAVRLREAYSNCLARVQGPAEDVTIPVDTHPDGSVKFVVSAKRAQFFLDSGLVWAENVVAKKFDTSGVLDTRIDARACVIDRYTRSGWAAGPARVCQGKTTLCGSDVYFSSQESYVRMFSGTDFATEDVDAGRAVSGGRLAKPSGQGGSSARIRSRSGDYDREAGVMFFEGDVFAEYGGEYTMAADSIYAFVSASNELSRVVALGGVTITNETRVGSCAMAAYRRRRREIEMFGGGGARARLVERGAKGGEVEGDRIRFWMDAEQVEIENSDITTGPLGGKGILWETPS